MYKPKLKLVPGDKIQLVRYKKGEMLGIGEEICRDNIGKFFTVKRFSAPSLSSANNPYSDGFVEVEENRLTWPRFCFIKVV